MPQTTPGPDLISRSWGVEDGRDHRLRGAVVPRLQAMPRSSWPSTGSHSTGLTSTRIRRGFVSSSSCRRVAGRSPPSSSRRGTICWSRRTGTWPGGSGSSWRRIAPPTIWPSSEGGRRGSPPPSTPRARGSAPWSSTGARSAGRRVSPSGWTTTPASRRASGAPSRGGEVRRPGAALRGGDAGRGRGRRAGAGRDGHRPAPLRRSADLRSGGAGGGRLLLPAARGARRGRADRRWRPLLRDLRRPLLQGAEELLVVGGGNSGLEEGMFLISSPTASGSWSSPRAQGLPSSSRTRSAPIPSSRSTPTPRIRRACAGPQAGGGGRPRPRERRGAALAPAGRLRFHGLDPIPPSSGGRFSWISGVRRRRRLRHSQPGIFCAGDVRAGSTKRSAPPWARGSRRCWRSGATGKNRRSRPTR